MCHGVFEDERSAKRALRQAARSVAPSYWLGRCMSAWTGEDSNLEYEVEPFYNEDGTPTDELGEDIPPHQHPLVSFVDRIGSGVACYVCHVTCTSSSDFTCTLCDEYNECGACHALSPVERDLAYSRRFFADYRVFMDGGDGTSKPFNFQVQTEKPHYYPLSVTAYTGSAWDHPNNASVIATAMEAAIEYASDGKSKANNWPSDEFSKVVDNFSTGFDMGGMEEEERGQHSFKFVRIVHLSDPGGKFVEKLRDTGPAGHSGATDLDSIVASLIGEYTGLPPIFILGKSYAAACCGGNISSLQGIGTAPQCRRLLRAGKLFPHQVDEPYSAFWRESEDEDGDGENENDDEDGGGGGGAGGGHYYDDDDYERREHKIKLAVDALKRGDHKSEELFDWTKKLNPEEWFNERPDYSWKEKWVYEGGEFKGGSLKITVSGAGCGGGGKDITCLKISS
jgi:hypothetical protein